MALRIKKHSALKTQGYVIKALFKRELITRFGKYKLGAIWLLLDPLVSVLLLGLVLGPFLGRSSGSIPYSFFLLCGFMMLKLLTGPIITGIGAIRSNSGLLVFRQVQPIDPFLARFLYEFVSSMLAFTLFCVVGYFLGVPLATDQLLGVLAAAIVTWLIGCGLGLAVGVLSMKFTELEKIITYIHRPMLFLSAILYPLTAVPYEYREYLLYNPLVHMVEYSRVCLFHEYETGDINFVYPIMFAIVSLTLGFMVYRNNRGFLTER